MMAEYVMQCEKAIKTDKITNLSKILQTKLEQLQRVRGKRALGQTNSPRKAAETEPTASTTTSTVTIAKASGQKEKGKTSTPKEKRKGEKEDNRKHSKEQPDVVAIASDDESDSELIVEQQEENVYKSAGTYEQHRQSVGTPVCLRWRPIFNSRKKSSYRSRRRKQDTQPKGANLSQKSLRRQ